MQKKISYQKPKIYADVIHAGTNPPTCMTVVRWNQQRCEGKTTKYH